MNKGLLIGAVVLVALLLVVGLGGAGVWYFFMRTTPESALQDATDYFENGKSYAYTTDAKVTMSMSGMTFEMDMDMEGKYDIENDKAMLTNTTETMGETSVQEVIVIGDKEYSRVDDSEWTETTVNEEDEASDEMYDEIFDDITSDNYELLEDEEVDGVNSYHYKIVMTEEELDEMMKSFTEDLEQGAGGSMNVSEYGTVDVELWVSKSDSKVQKLVMNIADMKMTMTSGGMDMDIETDMDFTFMYSDYGEDFEIEAPI